MNGIVRLLRNDEIIAANKYDCMERRHTVIELWRTTYGNRFYSMVISIIPEVREGIDRNGMNCRKDIGAKRKVFG